MSPLPGALRPRVAAKCAEIITREKLTWAEWTELVALVSGASPETVQAALRAQRAVLNLAFELTGDSELDNLADNLDPDSEEG